MSTRDMMNAALINIEIRDRVQDVYNSRQQCNFVSLIRLRECINVTQGATTSNREHKQSREIEQVNYINLAVANDKYKIGTEVQITKDGVWHDVNSYVLGSSGTVISCVRQQKCQFLLRSSVRAA